MKIPFWPPFKGIRDIELGLSRVFELLERLDNPHKKLPPTIHFAGTNGKGSTLNFLYQLLKKDNFKVHCYTSPHLIDFNERIILANQQISDDLLNECLAQTKEKSEVHPEIPVTFFEGITVAAFLAFSKVSADYLLLETGMGGRLDATNVLDQVLASVITPISFDHTDFLGNSIEKIAFEKAGIIKENCPVIIGQQEEEALKVITNQAKIKNAKTTIFNQDFRIQKHQNYFNFITNSSTTKIPNPTMIGSHQIHNLSLAIATYLEILPKGKKHQEQLKTTWPARLQEVQKNLYIDGSHNKEGATTVSEFLKSKNDTKRIVIYSSLQDKDHKSFLEIISNEVDELIITSVPNEPKGQNPKVIQHTANSLNIPNEIVEKIDINSLKNEDNLIIITGSLYSAGYYLDKILKESRNNQ